MRQEPVPVRGLVLIVCLGLLGGCSTGERRANHDWSRIGSGMTCEDVVGLIGQGDVTVRPDGTQVWHYSYGAEPDPEKIGIVTADVFMVLSLIGVLVLLLAAAGPGASLPDRDLEFPKVRDPESNSGRVHFRVVFDRTGNVTEVSGLEPCEE